LLICLEGPDKCGKTSMFNALRGKVDAVFVPGLPIAKELFPVMYLAELRNVKLWELLYDPSRLYVCDRSPLVTHNAYSMVYGRRFVHSDLLQRETRIAYFKVPEAELRRRYAAIGDENFDAENYSKLLAAYDHVLRDFNVTVFNAPTVDEVAEWIQELVKDGCNGASAPRGRNSLPTSSV